MTVEQVMGLVLALAIMLIGTAGTILPVIPGTPIILGAAIVHRLYFGEASVSFPVLGILTVLALLSFVLEYVGQVLGAKQLGGTWKGMAGAVVGGIVGLFFGIVGIILGSFAGATLMELIGGRQMKPAAKAGVGAVIGLLIGAVGNFSVCVAMMILFAVTVVYRS